MGPVRSRNPVEPVVRHNPPTHELEALVRGRASAQGLSFSDVMANAIAVSFDREPVIEPRHDQFDDDQEHLLAS